MTHASSTPRDPYSILGVERDAEQGEIKRAYFRLVREYSPEEEPEKFQEIRAAYDRVKSPERRAQTDLFLLQAPPETPNRRRPSYELSVRDEDLVALARELRLADVDPDVYISDQAESE